MPFIRDEDIGQVRQIPEAPVAESADALSSFRESFARENSVISWAERGFGLTPTPEPVLDFNPFEGDQLEGYEMFADEFIDVRSPLELEQKKMILDRQVEQLKAIENGGVEAVAGAIAGGVMDPVYWPFMLAKVPGLIKTSSSALGAGARVGLLSGGLEIPAEALKSAAQETRTVGESAINISGATLLGGILGSAGQALTKAEFNRMAADLEDFMNAPDPPVAAAPLDSVGAARRKELSFDDYELVPTGIKIEDLPVSPQLRLETSGTTVGRKLASEMLESASVKKAHTEGVSTMPEGGAVETRIKGWDANLYRGIKEVRRSFADYRKTGGKLSRKEFNIAVGKAARRGDAHDIPQIQASAEAVRREIFDPLKEAAIKEKLLPPDVDVTTAMSYLTRIYRTERIIARRGEWDNIVEGWLKTQRGLAKTLESPNARQKIEMEMSDREIKEIANQITDNILGVSSGRMPYEAVALARGPLKERVFDIPDNLIEDFLESDIDIVTRQYVSTMAPDVELSRMYGDVTMKEQLEVDLPRAYKKRIDAAKTEKQRRQLQAELEQAQEDIAAIRDLLRGTYKLPENPSSVITRTGKSLRTFNFIRMLGGMTLSAIPDIARPIAVNGLKPFTKSLTALATSPKRFKMAAEEAKRAAAGIDMVLNRRATSMADVTDVYGRNTAFERGLAASGDAFGMLSLMTPWNAAWKQIAGVTTQDRFLTDLFKVADGKAGVSVTTRLANAGIGKEQAELLAMQAKKYSDVDGGLKIANTHLWDSSEAVEIFRSALLKDVDRTIITPSVGERPLWTSSEMGKMAFQFKNFAASAHHKILIADMQYRDAQALSGFLLSVALGTMVYGLKQWTAGREISTRPDTLIVESIDRSGALGYFFEVNNTVEKLTRGNVSVGALAAFATGQNPEPMSRFVSRNWLGALAGPTPGTLLDAGNVIGAISEGEMTESELRSLRKLIPGQNLFYLRTLLDKIEEQAGDEL